MTERTFSQTESAYRQSCILKLPIDCEHFYETRIDSSRYLSDLNSLSVFMGEKLLLEVESDGASILSMSVVKENFNPEKTLVVELIQNVKNCKSESVLKIYNPFKEDLKYKMQFRIVGHVGWVETYVLPVKAGMTAYERRSGIIIEASLYTWEFY